MVRLEAVSTTPLMTGWFAVLTDQTLPKLSVIVPLPGVQ